MHAYLLSQIWSCDNKRPLLIFGSPWLRCSIFCVFWINRESLLSGLLPPVAVLPWAFVQCLFPAPLVLAHQHGDATLKTGRLVPPDPRQWLIHDGGGMASAPWDLKAAALMPAPPKPHPAPSAPPLLLFPAKPWHAPRL